MQDELRLPKGAPLWIALACLTALPACRSSDGAAEPEPEGVPYQSVEPDGPAPIGSFLAELDKSVRAWTTLILTARTDADRAKAKGLERELRARTERRKDELIEQLETGPPQNRVRAAGALGFTGDPAALSPLLAALYDDSPDVVCNALLGLTLLQLPETPLGPLAQLLQGDPDAQIRANAGYAIRSVIEAGGTPVEAAVRAAQLGVIDEDPLVRVHCALILGLSSDTPSIPALRDMLLDDLPLVVHSATRGLVMIGKADDTARGQVGRILAQALRTAKREARPRFRLALVDLAGKNLGEDPGPWIEWANRLP